MFCFDFLSVRLPGVGCAYAVKGRRLQSHVMPCQLFDLTPLRVAVLWWSQMLTPLNPLDFISICFFELNGWKKGKTKQKQLGKTNWGVEKEVRGVPPSRLPCESNACCWLSGYTSEHCRLASIDKRHFSQILQALVVQAKELHARVSCHGSVYAHHPFAGGRSQRRRPEEYRQRRKRCSEVQGLLVHGLLQPVLTWLCSDQVEKLLELTPSKAIILECGLSIWP